MPVVPKFAGGVPAVSEKTPTDSTFAIQSVKTDYETVMANATKPIDVVAHGMARIADIEYNRWIKAQSDDLEGQAIQAIQDATQGENGYFGKLGIDAVKGYQKASDDLERNINELGKNADPRVLEVVNPRIKDRLQSAKARMQTWCNHQRSAYEKASAEGRRDLLLSDISANAGDSEHVAKSIASLVENERYIQRLAGMGDGGPAVTAAVQSITQKAYVARFGGLCEIDPVAAANLFVKEKANIDPNIRGAVWDKVFSKSVKALGMELAKIAPGDEQVTPDSKVESWFTNPDAKTGIPAYDEATPYEKAQIRQQAILQLKRVQSTVKDGLKKAQDKSFVFAKNGQAEGMLDRADFVSIMGESPKVDDAYDKYREQYLTYVDEHALAHMRTEDIDSYVKAMKPEPGTKGSTYQQKRYEKLTKLAQRIKTERQNDPIGYLIKTGNENFKQIDWANEEAVYTGISARIRNIDTIQDVKSGRLTLLSKAEAGAATKYLDSLKTVDEKMRALETLEDAFLDVRNDASKTTNAKDARDAYSALARQLPERYSLAMLYGNVSPNGSDSLGKLYLEGVSTEKAGTEIVNSSSKRIIEGHLDGVFPIGSQDELDFKRVAYGATVAYMARTGETDEIRALQSVIGKVENYNGRDTILPPGVSYRTYLSREGFTDRVAAVAEDIATGSESYRYAGKVIGAKEMGEILEDCELAFHTYGTQTGVEGIYYRVSRGGVPILRAKDNKQLLIFIGRK